MSHGEIGLHRGVQQAFKQTPKWKQTLNNYSGLNRCSFIVPLSHWGKHKSIIYYSRPLFECKANPILEPGCIGVQEALSITILNDCLCHLHKKSKIVLFLISTYSLNWYLMGVNNLQSDNIICISGLLWSLKSKQTCWLRNKCKQAICQWESNFWWSIYYVRKHPYRKVLKYIFSKSNSGNVDNCSVAGSMLFIHALICNWSREIRWQHFQSKRHVTYSTGWNTHGYIYTVILSQSMSSLGHTLA